PLIRCPPDDQIGRQRSADLREARTDRRIEAIDLLAFLHLGRDGDRAAPLPRALRIAPRVVREKTGRVLVAAMDAAEIAEVERRAVRRLREQGGVDVRERANLPRLLEREIASAGIQRACR